MSEPRRLIERDDLEGSLLRSAREDGPSPAAKRALGIALGLAPIVPLVPPAPPPLAGTATTAAAGKTGAAAAIAAKAGVPIGVKVIAVVLGVGLSVGVGVKVTRSSSLQPSAPQVQEVASLPLPLPVPVPVPVPVQAIVPPAAVVAADPIAPAPMQAPMQAPIAHTPQHTVHVAATLEPTTTTPPPPPPPPSPAASSVAPISTLSDEVAALDIARDALRHHDAAGALANIDQYAKQFPAGTLAPEAIVVRIEALFEAGRTTDARALADQYLATHSSSPLAPRVRDLIAQHPDTR